MDLQLELLPYHYYNILGFEAELIDYIYHVNDSVVLEKIAPLYMDELVELFMQKTPDTTTKNNAGRSQIDFAKQVGNVKLIKMLVERIFIIAPNLRYGSPYCLR